MRTLPLVLIAASALSCAPRRGVAPPPLPVSAAGARWLLEALAHDSTEGRRAGTAGERRAARVIAERMRGMGLQPAGDSGYFQRVPMALAERRVRRPDGQEGVVEELRLLPSFADLDTVPDARRRPSANVLGLIPGSDPDLAQEVVVVGAHYDHVGIGTPVAGDSVYNGADDDASGVTAVIEAARILAAGPRPKRSVLFAAFTAEEAGAHGVVWYTRHPIRPLARHVADLQVEMIGRPDSLAGGPGNGWLTGYERSTMGDAFAAAGLPIRADARPQFRFFERSDNIVFARLGIVAHTLSSYGMHDEYHRPSDEPSRIDYAHLARMIEVTARAVRLLADGPPLEWKPGGKP